MLTRRKTRYTLSADKTTNYKNETLIEMSQIYLGELLINTGSGSGGGSYDDTELRGYIEDLQNYVPEYLTKVEYDALVQNNTVDPNKMYIITDLATQDDLDAALTGADIDSEVNRLKSEITNAKDVAVSEVSMQKTISVDVIKEQEKKSVNSVKSQETLSTNNLNTVVSDAVSNAQTTLQNMIDNAPRVVIMTVAEYEALSSINTNFVYILKPNPTE